MPRSKREPVRTVDTDALDRTVGTPGYERLWNMIRDRIAAKDAAEDAAERDTTDEAA